MEILYTIIRAYELILLARILLSWLHPDPRNLIVEWIYRLTEPVLAPIRRLLPTGGMGFDFSPVIVLIALDLLKRLFANPSMYF